MASPANKRTPVLSRKNPEIPCPRANGTEAPDDDFSDALTATQRHLRAAQRRNCRLTMRCEQLGMEMRSLKKALEKAEEFAYYDELTGVANRRLLLERFNQAAALGKRRQQQVMLVFLDLDEFKSINDALGHTIGDALLRQVAARMTALVRSSDTVCRYGGDEFVVLLTEIGNYDDTLMAVDRLLDHLAMPFDVDGTSIEMSVSHGTAVYPDDGHACRELIQQSDIAMYRVKSRKRTVPV